MEFDVNRFDEYREDNRLEAKKAKDYAEADRIRDEIQAKGYVVKDVPGGFKIEKA